MPVSAGTQPEGDREGRATSLGGFPLRWNRKLIRKRARQSRSSGSPTGLHFSSGLFEPAFLSRSIPRRSQRQVSQQHRHLCSLGTCQTHRLPEIIYWLRSASTKELSGKAGREPQDPHSYGRRRRRAARLLLRLQDPSLRQGGQRSARLSG